MTGVTRQLTDAQAQELTLLADGKPHTSASTNLIRRGLVRSIGHGKGYEITSFGREALAEKTSRIRRHDVGFSGFSQIVPSGNPPQESDDWERTPHSFVAKLWEREGDPGYDGDPESCALCHLTEGNPIHSGESTPRESRALVREELGGEAAPTLTAPATKPEAPGSALNLGTAESYARVVGERDALRAAPRVCDGARLTIRALLEWIHHLERGRDVNAEWAKEIRDEAEKEVALLPDARAVLGGEAAPSKTDSGGGRAASSEGRKA